MWYNNRNAAIVRLDRLIQRRKFGKGAISILRIWYNHTMCGENLTTKTVLQDLPGPLLAWYRANARDLPWRRTTDPYQIWVSEIMLQQTRVAAVLGYYARFLETFPTVEALAAAPEERLMKLWEGLGYYSRARNLKAAAIQVMERFNGALPASYEALLSLPGIGSYTAGAIASIAYGIPVPAVDGNVLRVVSRILADSSDIRKASVKTSMEALLKEVMPKDCAGSYNQALIETGALVCIPGGEPKCRECPMESVCLTAQNGLWKKIPWKSPPKERKVEERTVFIIEYQEKAAIRKRPPKGLLASLYELPNAEGKLSPKEAEAYLAVSEDDLVCLKPLPDARHVFSHIEWRMSGYHAVLKEPWRELPDGVFMASREEIEKQYPLPNAFSAYREILFKKEDGQ